MKATQFRKFCENDTFKFFCSSGTYSDALEMQKSLLAIYGKKCFLQLHPVYGWIVRVLQF